MGMIECRECKAHISDTAKSCPQCGYTGRKPTSLGTYLGALLALGFVLVVFFPKHEGSTSTDAAAPEVSEKSRMIDACLEATKGRLEHPLSFDYNSFSVAAARSTSVDAWLVAFDFKANNGFGNPIPQKAKCVINLGQSPILEISN